MQDIRCKFCNVIRTKICRANYDYNNFFVIFCNQENYRCCFLSVNCRISLAHFDNRDIVGEIDDRLARRTGGLFVFRLRFQAKLFRLHVRRLLESVGEMRRVEKAAFLSYEGNGFVGGRKHSRSVGNSYFFEVFHRRGVENLLEISEEIGRRHVYNFR